MVASAATADDGDESGVALRLPSRSRCDSTTTTSRPRPDDDAADEETDDANDPFSLTSACSSSRVPRADAPRAEVDARSFTRMDAHVATSSIHSLMSTLYVRRAASGDAFPLPW